MTGRWGIFGGLFDPVHYGHIRLASHLARAAELDGILWVPAAQPPHKDKNQPASFKDRLAMLRLALQDLPNMVISDIEAAAELSGYALDMVRAVKKRYPEPEFCFIMGADNVTDIVNWYHYDQLLSEIDVIAGSRGGVEMGPAGAGDSRLRCFEIEPTEMASSDIRGQIRDGADLEFLLKALPPEVLEFISTKGLYL